MDLKNYEIDRAIADTIEQVLLERRNDPSSLYRFTLTTLESLKESFRSDSLDFGAEKVEKMIDAVKKDPDSAVLVLYRLLRVIRLATLEDIYETIVRPVSGNGKESFS
ncbi:MAG: hypothetical protein IJK53_07310 [Erysipelotrichaceae bacterium]|nr:hypothetical protein [Clostridia bacterium]MBQ6217177.1 hypothetical protein [Erysipelotrichaceae bacterium]